MAKPAKKTEYQTLLAKYIKKNKKNPPVGTSTADLRKMFKTKKRKSASKTSKKRAGDDLTELFGGW